MSSKRVRYEVLPIPKAQRAGFDRWKVTRDGVTLATFQHKDGKTGGALQFAATVARAAWRDRGELGTLKIKGRDGKIKDERTYGRDPTKTKG